MKGKPIFRMGRVDPQWEEYMKELNDILGVYGLLKRDFRGHWVRYRPDGRKIQSPYDVNYNIEQRYWFFKNSYILVECDKCIQVTE